MMKSYTVVKPPPAKELKEDLKEYSDTSSIAAPTDKIKLMKQNMSPWPEEIQVITAMVRECFEKNSKPPKTSTEFYKVGKILG